MPPSSSFECADCGTRAYQAQLPCERCGGNRYVVIPPHSRSQAIETVLYFLAGSQLAVSVLRFHADRSRYPRFAALRLLPHDVMDVVAVVIALPIFFVAASFLAWALKIRRGRIPSIPRGERGDLLFLILLTVVVSVGVVVTWDVFSAALHS